MLQNRKAASVKTCGFYFNFAFNIFLDFAFGNPSFYTGLAKRDLLDCNKNSSGHKNSIELDQNNAELVLSIED